MKKNVLDSYVKKLAPNKYDIRTNNGQKHINDSFTDNAANTAVSLLKKEANKYVDNIDSTNIKPVEVKKFLSPKLELYILPGEFKCKINGQDIKLNYYIDKSHQWYLKITDKSGSSEFEKMTAEELVGQARLINPEEKNWLYSLCCSVNSKNKFESWVDNPYSVQNLINMGAKVDFNEHRGEKTMSSGFYDWSNPLPINIIIKNVTDLFTSHIRNYY